MALAVSDCKDSRRLANCRSLCAIEIGAHQSFGDRQRIITFAIIGSRSGRVTAQTTAYGGKHRSRFDACSAAAMPIPKYRVWARLSMRLTSFEKLYPPVVAART